MAPGHPSTPMSALACLALGAAAGLAVLLWTRRPRAVARRRSRTAAVERVLASIPGNHVLVTCPERHVASRILARVDRRLHCRHAADAVIVPVRLDLRDVPEERLFAAIGGAVLGLLGPRLGMPAVGPAPRDPGYDFHNMVRDLQRLTTALAQRCGPDSAVALFIDHAEYLDRYGSRTAQRLRSLLMRGFAERLVCVAGADRISREWSCHTSPWFNVFEEIQVQ